MEKKKEKSLWEKFLSYDNFYKALKKVNKAKNRKTIQAILFNKDETINLNKLIMELRTGIYKPSGYSKFFVYEPKKREIYAPAFRDKIVQIALNSVLKEVLYPIFINDSYGSIDNKGTHKAVDKVQHNMRCAKRKWGNNAQTLKLDIERFFYTIDREILKELFRKYIEDKYILDLLYKITDSAYVVGNVGIPLGNTISQLSSNLYLNELDQYLKRTFGLRYYVRYMDDTFIQVESKEKAKEILDAANNFVQERLHLKLNKHKSTYFPINNCVNGLGYKIWSTHKKLRNRSKRKIKNILKHEGDKDKLRCRIYSWLGSAEKANSYNFINKKCHIHEILRELENVINNN